MKITILALMFVALTAMKVSACGDGECDPIPEPPVVVVPDTPMVDGDSAYDPYVRIYYAICTCDKMKVAWGFESLELRTNKARSQCEIRRTERLKCPVKWK